MFSTRQEKSGNKRRPLHSFFSHVSAGANGGAECRRPRTLRIHTTLYSRDEPLCVSRLFPPLALGSHSSGRSRSRMSRKAGLQSVVRPRWTSRRERSRGIYTAPRPLIAALGNGRNASSWAKATVGFDAFNSKPLNALALQKPTGCRGQCSAPSPTKVNGEAIPSAVGRRRQFPDDVIRPRYCGNLQTAARHGICGAERVTQPAARASCAGSQLRTAGPA